MKLPRTATVTLTYGEMREILHESYKEAFQRFEETLHREFRLSRLPGHIQEEIARVSRQAWRAAESGGE